MDKFKDVRGVHKVESLFFETIQPKSRKRYTPIYSLRDYDHKGYPSAYNLYINSVDEHQAALAIVGSLAHWRKLTRLEWFLNGRPECQFEGLLQWREDMKARDASAARKVLQDLTVNESNVTAAKALLSESKVKIPKTPKLIHKKLSKSDSNVTDFLSKWDEK